jgi:hypothetical protein
MMGKLVQICDGNLYLDNKLVVNDQGAGVTVHVHGNIFGGVQGCQNLVVHGDVATGDVHCPQGSVVVHGHARVPKRDRPDDTTHDDRSAKRPRQRL